MNEGPNPGNIHAASSARKTYLIDCFPISLPACSILNWSSSAKTGLVKPSKLPQPDEDHLVHGPLLVNPATAKEPVGLSVYSTSVCFQARSRPRKFHCKRPMYRWSLELFFTPRPCFLLGLQPRQLFLVITHFGAITHRSFARSRSWRRAVSSLARNP